MNISKIQILGLVIVAVIIGGAILFNITTSDSNKETFNQVNQNQIVDEDEATSDKINMMQDNQQSNATSTTVVAENFSHMVTLTTNMGVIKFNTYDTDAPKTVNNFLTLAQKGFYNNLIFHRVIDKFMIQGGDPTGTGAGGPGYQFEDELNPETESYKKGYVTGVVAMANAGPNTNGSQFFIMVDDVPLGHDYSIFGQVVEGQEVANAISKVKTGAADRPVTEVKITKVEVEKIK